MPRRPPFDPAATYVVRRGFSHQGRLMRTGEPFDITTMRPHAARILYNAGRLSMARGADVLSSREDVEPLFPAVLRAFSSPRAAEIVASTVTKAAVKGKR